jgi:ubiquinone/menaquinone biosynthesis C-methylase UbiE
MLARALNGFHEGAKEKDHLIAGDLNPTTLNYAKNQNIDLDVNWKILDATRILLADSSIDFFTCFETLEHVSNLDSALSEFARILAPSGVGFFSTPQNCFGEVPLTWWHEKEFSFQEIHDAISKYFRIDRFIGIKQGTIFIEGDPIGANSFVVVSTK